MNALVKSEINKLIASFCTLLLIWLLLVFSSFWSAVEIWIGNEIYNHCLVVIPASIYLIYEQRHQINWAEARMSWLAVFFFFLQLLFYILATAADIQLFQHIAVFSMLPTLFWIFVGNKIAWELKFPLLFVLFAVPVGEELIPFLQEITADMSVYLLKITGIPLYRSGLFIEIPQGKFLVAEACSGVSFLIASIVLGNLYAYMNLKSMRRRIFFFVLSIAFPIFANAIRVYGIIYIGYSTDMEHAVGADHLIYGWFFFAFVLVCLFLIGEVIRRNEIKKNRALEDKNTSNEHLKDDKLSAASIPEFNNNTGAIATSLNTRMLIVLLSMILLTYFQILRMDTVFVSDLANKDIDLKLENYENVANQQQVKWQPRFVGHNVQQMYHLSDGDDYFNVYFAYFDGSKGELVSSLHRLYEQDRWTRESRRQIVISKSPALKEVATTSVGVKKEIIYWYVVDDKIVNSYRAVKIHQLIKKLSGSASVAKIVAVAIDTDRNSDSKENKLNKLASDVFNQNFQ